MTVKARAIFEEVMPVEAGQKPHTEHRFAETSLQSGSRAQTANTRPPTRPPNARSQFGPWVPAPLPPSQDDFSFLREGLAQTAQPLRRFYKQQFDQEHIIAMSKISLFGLISGLMLLGILFFMAGFLVALGTLEPTKPLNQPQPTAWGAINTAPGAVAAGAHTQRGGFARMAQGQVASANAGVTKLVPKALQPLAQPLIRQGKQQESIAVHGAIQGQPPVPQSQQPAQQPAPQAQPAPQMPPQMPPPQPMPQAYSPPQYSSR